MTTAPLCPWVISEAWLARYSSRPGPMLQQRGLPVGDQQTEIQSLEAGDVLGRGEDEHGVVSCRDRRKNELRHQSAQSVRALVGGRDGQHFEDVAGAGAARDKLAILEEANQIVELRLKAQPLGRDQFSSLAQRGAIEQHRSHSSAPPSLTTQLSLCHHRGIVIDGAVRRSVEGVLKM